MPDCDYCDDSFASESAYLDHLAAAHEDELGRIDRRRVERHVSESGLTPPPTVIYGVAGLALLVLAAGSMYFVVQTFSEPDDVHEHGTFEIVVDGEQITLHQDQRFTSPNGNPNPPFHVHSGQPGVWHMHPHEPGRLTVTEGFAEMGIELTASRLVLDGETYDATRDGVDLSVTVNGEAVDPESYVLEGVGQRPPEQGDSLRIVVETDGSETDGSGTEGSDADGENGTA